MLMKAVTRNRLSDEFESVVCIYIEMTNILKLLSGVFKHSLLFTLTTQFVMMMNISYTLFLAVNGLTDVSALMTASATFWVVFEFVILLTLIVVCEHNSNEVINVLNLVRRLDWEELGDTRNVSLKKHETIASVTSMD